MRGRKKRKELRKLLDEYDIFLSLSEALGVPLSDEEENYKDVLDQHPEYARYRRGGELVTKDGRRVNPRLHIAVEAAVQWQMAKDDPPEVNEAYLALLGAGVDPHEARHAIGYLMAEMIWLTLQNRLPEPKTHYAAQLRELKHQGIRHRVFSGQ